MEQMARTPELWREHVLLALDSLGMPRRQPAPSGAANSWYCPVIIKAGMKQALIFEGAALHSGLEHCASKVPMSEPQPHAVADTHPEPHATVGTHLYTLNYEGGFGTSVNETTTVVGQVSLRQYLGADVIWATPQDVAEWISWTKDDD